MTTMTTMTTLHPWLGCTHHHGNTHTHTHNKKTFEVGNELRAERNTKVTLNEFSILSLHGAILKHAAALHDHNTHTHTYIHTYTHTHSLTHSQSNTHSHAHEYAYITHDNKVQGKFLPTACRCRCCSRTSTHESGPWMRRKWVCRSSMCPNDEEMQIEIRNWTPRWQ